MVTKFIRKDKVHADHWVDDPSVGRRVPLEVSLLSMLHHPNIVSRSRRHHRSTAATEADARGVGRRAVAVGSSPLE